MCELSVQNCPKHDYVQKLSELANYRSTSVKQKFIPVINFTTGYIINIFLIFLSA